MKTVRISKSNLWDALNYRPNEAQRAVHKSAVRNRVNVAGRRTGKSVGGGRELMPRAQEAYHLRGMLEERSIRYECWIVGPNYTDSEKEFRVFYNDCRKLQLPFDKPGTYYNPKGDMVVSLWDGRFIVHGRSGDHPESLVGEGLHFAVMAEAAKMKESVWERFIRPTLADFWGESLWDTTPEGKNWFYDLYRKGQDPAETEWESWRHPSWVNRHVFRKRTTMAGIQQMKLMLRQAGYDREDFDNIDVDPEIISMARDLTEEAFGQEVEASFSEHVGRVFKAWDEDQHVTDLAYRPDWPLYIATDYGYTDPNVALFIQIGPSKEINVIAEYYRTHRTDSEFARDVLEDSRLRHLVGCAKGIYPDPADPGATETISEAWKLPHYGNTGGELKHRIEAIQLKLKPRNPHLAYENPERVPWLRFDRTTKNCQREFDAYRWPEKRKEAGKTGPEHPMDKDNHTPEALGRFFAGHGLTKNGQMSISKATQHKPHRGTRRR